MKAALVALGGALALALLPRDRAPAATAGVAPAVETAGCRPGFAWRRAGAADAVCVGHLSRDRAALENRLAASRRDPSAPPGSAACRHGLVWREAFDGDIVCVTPRVRDQVREENAVAARQAQPIREAAVGSAPAPGLSAPASQ